MSIATSDDLSPDLERLEVEQIIEVAVLNDMRLLIAPVEIARGGEHNSATFRIIQQPASLDGYVCRAEVQTSEGTTYRLVVGGEFSLTSDIAVPGIGELQLVYSDGLAVIRKSYSARFHVTQSINAIDESDPDFQDGLGQITTAAFANVDTDNTGIRFYNIAFQPVGFAAWPIGQGGALDEATANLLYVRQDGTSLMSGDLRLISSQGIDGQIGVYVGGRQASIYWQNALQLRRGQAGEPVQVANNDGSAASDIVTVASGDARYLREINAGALYVERSGSQMTGPLITMSGGSTTNPGLAIGENSTGFFRAGNTLLLSVGGALYAQWLQAPASVMFTVPLNMATYPINNVADPVAVTDAANRRFVEAQIAAIPRPTVPAARAFIANEITLSTDPQVFFNQPFFTNDNTPRTIVVTAYPQFDSGTAGSFYDLEYSTNLSVGLVERLGIYPTQNLATYMGAAPVCFAATVTPVSGQIAVSLSARMMVTNPTPLVQVGSRTAQRTTVVIQEMSN